MEDREGAESSAIGELIGDEVHRPDVIARRCRPALLAMHGGGVSPWPFPSQRQALLGVQAIAPFLAELPALASQQHQQSTIAKSHAGLGELAESLA